MSSNSHSADPRPESRAGRMVREIFESGRPVTYLRSSEEQRVAKVLCEVAAGLSAPVWTWSLTEGMQRNGGATEAGAETPRGALDFIASYLGSAIFHLKDFHEPLRESADIRRRLRDVHERCLNQHKFVVITSPIR